MLDSELQAQVFDFEGVEDGLPLLPLAARRALDVAGFRLSLEGWQSLAFDDRRLLCIEGSREAVDAPTVERVVRRSMLPATRIRPVPDPDPLQPPDQLAAALASRRSVAPTQWSKLRSLDRYALVHVLRRAVAHDDPQRLELALAAILPRAEGSADDAARRKSVPPDPPHTQPSETQHNPKRNGTNRPAPRQVSSQPRVDGTPALDSSRHPAAPPAPPADRFEPMEIDLEASERFVRRLSTLPPKASEDDGRPTPVISEPPSMRSAELAAHHYGDETLPASRPPVAPAAPPPAALVGPPPALPVPPLAADPAPVLSTHLTQGAEAKMVDVGDKDVSDRRATATGVVRMRKETAQKMARHEGPKGEVLSVARLAGIMAAKRTPDLIPLCHTIALTKVEVHVDVEAMTGIVTVMAIVEARDRTGVEMEALTAVSTACLTIYDMLKGVDRDMVISDIKLVQKSGGRGGAYQRKE